MYLFLLCGYLVFCLNNFTKTLNHLLIETPEGNLSKGMRQLNGIYAQHFNQKHQRLGHLLQGRYRSILVDKENYLLELSCYMVLNPVRAGIVKDPGDYKWSSYQATAGDTHIPVLLTDWILSQFSEERGKSFMQYQAFVRSGIKKASPLKEVKGQLYLGKETFKKRISPFLKERSKEIPLKQRYANRPSLEDALNRFDKHQRDQAIYIVHVHHGYTLKEIAKYLGIHYATVSRAVKRMEGKD